jgi:hypothetical protein
VDRFGWWVPNLEAAAALAAGGLVLAVLILSVAVAIVIVRGSWSAKRPDQYALRVLSGLPSWLWPWRARFPGRLDSTQTDAVGNPGDRVRRLYRRSL